MPVDEYLVALGHLSGEGGDFPANININTGTGDGHSVTGSVSNNSTGKRRSLWSGFKQMFRGRESNGTRSTSATAISRRDPPQSLSYSCLGGDGKRRTGSRDDEDMYREEYSFIHIHLTTKMLKDDINKL